MPKKPTSNPHNRFQLAASTYDPGEDPGSPVQVFDDVTREILSHNTSEDIGFRWTVNPYRGCQHACAYCYARPTHEYLSWGAGSDFDTKIMAKRNAPELLRAAFDRPSWMGETVVFSGVTDCYQPLEQKLELTRACLQVCAAYRNPVGIITKSPIVERDVDVLLALHERAQVRVSVSVPFLDADNARAVEPGVATPQRRLRVIETLAKAGIPVGVMVAPVIPGLSDEDIPGVLQAAADVGATHAGYVMLRLPGSVKAVFEERMRAAFPDRVEKMLHRIRECSGGALYDARPHIRQRGTGAYADVVGTLFRTTATRLGLIGKPRHDGADLVTTTFVRPPKRTPQLALFGE